MARLPFDDWAVVAVEPLWEPCDSGEECEPQARILGRGAGVLRGGVPRSRYHS